MTGWLLFKAGVEPLLTVKLGLTTQKGAEAQLLLKAWLAGLETCWFGWLNMVWYVGCVGCVGCGKVDWGSTASTTSTTCGGDWLWTQEDGRWIRGRAWISWSLWSCDLVCNLQRWSKTQTWHDLTPKDSITSQLLFEWSPLWEIDVEEAKSDMKWHEFLKSIWCLYQLVSDSLTCILAHCLTYLKSARLTELERKEETKKGRKEGQLTWKSRVPHLAPGKLQKSRQCRPRMLHNALSKQQWKRHALHSLRIGLLEVRAGSDNLDESGWWFVANTWTVASNEITVQRNVLTEKSKCGCVGSVRRVIHLCIEETSKLVLSHVNHPSPSRYISLPGFHFIRTQAKRLTQQSSRSKLW